MFKKRPTTVSPQTLDYLLPTRNATPEKTCLFNNRVLIGAALTPERDTRLEACVEISESGVALQKLLEDESFRKKHDGLGVIVIDGQFSATVIKGEDAHEQVLSTNPHSEVLIARVSCFTPRIVVQKFQPARKNPKEKW